jgi:hypothetical protein
MKNVRGGQRRLRQLAQRMSIKPSILVEGEEEKEGKKTIASSSASVSSNWEDMCSAGFGAIMAKGFNSTIISPTHRVMLEHDIRPLQTYPGKITPALHECIEFCKSNLLAKLFGQALLTLGAIVTSAIWTVFLPAPSSTELSPLALDWFSMIRTSPALFHSSISFAGSYIEARDPTKLLTRRPELIAHDMEAIRQINFELSRNNLSDAVLLAITGDKVPAPTSQFGSSIQPR